MTPQSSCEGRHMLDISTEEKLIEKVGGKFKLTALIQKRLVELNRGARPLVSVPSGRPVDVIVREILEDKIALAPREEVGYTLEEEAKRLKELRKGEDEKEIYGSEIKKIKEQRIKELAELLNPKT